MNGKKSEREKLLADAINDLLLIAEFYHDGYPFDEDQKKHHTYIFHYAHQLINNTWMDIGKQVGWMTEHDKGSEGPREVKDYIDVDWSKI